MKKQGYTLAEVLITLGIIGILAAIMIPLANKFRPDTTKVAYLTTYDSLVTALNGIVNDTTLYPGLNTKRPLVNTSAVEIDGIQIAAGANKLCRILNETLRSEANNIDFKINNACSDNYIDANFNATKDFSRDFTAKNGAQFKVGRVFHTYYETDIYVDINGDEGNNCIYDAETCPNPDRFKFFVGANGKIVPADPMGIHYLETRTNLKVQKDVEIDGSYPDFPQDMQTIGQAVDIKDDSEDVKLAEDDIELNKHVNDFAKDDADAKDNSDIKSNSDLKEPCRYGYECYTESTELKR